MLDHLINRTLNTTRTALTWPFDLAADFLRQTAESLLDASKAFEMAGNITDPNPTDGPWEPGDADYAHAAELIEQTKDIRIRPTDDYSHIRRNYPDGSYDVLSGDGFSQWTPEDGIAVQTHADGSKTITGPDGITHYHRDGSIASHLGAPLSTLPPTDYSDSYTATDAEVDGYWEDGDSA